VLRRPVESGNYTSHDFATTIAELDLRHSVGRTGICYDNAMAESFFAALKNERVHRTAYPTREHARRDVTPELLTWQPPQVEKVLVDEPVGVDGRAPP
jgi:transposase InsO family protein